MIMEIYSFLSSADTDRASFDLTDELSSEIGEDFVEMAIPYIAEISDTAAIAIGVCAIIVFIHNVFLDQLFSTQGKV